MLKLNFGPSSLVVFFVLFIIATFHIHIKIQKTLIGYEIGDLKQAESKLMEKKGFLTMELAKVTSKKNLQQIIDK